MNYRLKTSRRGRQIKTSLIMVIILIIAFIIILSIDTLPNLSSSLNFIGRPFWNFSENTGSTIRSMFSVVESKASLIGENDKLRQENASLKIANQATLSLQAENLELRSLLNRTDQKGSLLAKILAGPNITTYDTFIVDAGNNLGVEIGDLVSAGNAIVGKVIEVNKTSSKIKLLSSPDEKLEVKIGKSGAIVVAYGKGGSNMETKLPKGINIAVGDPVTIPSISDKLFATVEAVESKPIDSFQTILMRVPINVNQVSFVEIIKP